MFNTQRILDILSFNLPNDITLDSGTISAGKVVLIREEDVYNFYRYFDTENGFIQKNIGSIAVKDGSSFFQCIFKVDVIEEADVHL